MNRRKLLKLVPSVMAMVVAGPRVMAAEPKVRPKRAKPFVEDTPRINTDLSESTVDCVVTGVGCEPPLGGFYYD